MLKVPVGSLGDNFKDLIGMLTVANPEAKTQAFFGSKFAQNKVPEKLSFYELDKPSMSILLPRNIDKKYFPNVSSYSYDVAKGLKINQGFEDKFKLRPHQDEFFAEQVLPHIATITNDISKNNKPIDLLLNAECGSGKTVMSLFMASIYARSTLVVVTTKKIGNQFMATVKDLFPQWTVGWEDGKNTYDITLATYSLMSSSRYAETFFYGFGHIIFDEYHRAGAESYQSILSKAKCQYRTTLTATFRRKDGLHKILVHHIGSILEMPRTSRKAKIYPVNTGVKLNEIEFRNVDRMQTKVYTDDERKLPYEKRDKLGRLEQFMEVAVKHAKSRLELDRGAVIEENGDEVIIHSMVHFKSNTYKTDEVTFHKLGTIAMAILDNEITEMNNRNDLIIKIISQCIQSGRKVLVLSKRKNLLYTLYYRLGRYGINSGIVVSEKAKDYVDFCKKLGRTIPENRDLVFNSADVILGIDKLAEEGLDVPHIDTIIYLHPMSDIEQSIGRVTREMAGKKESLGFYLLDNVSPYRKMWEKKDGAKAMFKSLGHDVRQEININEVKDLAKNGEI